MFSQIIFGVEGSFQGELSCGLNARVGFGLDKLTVVMMFDQFDEIRVKHESTFEYADDNKIDVPLFFLEMRIVLIDLRCYLSDHGLYGGLVVKKTKRESFVSFGGLHWSLYKS